MGPHPESPASPLLSLIIPVLNEEGRIRETLADILVKTAQERVEIIVVDGGSGRDRTMALLQEFKEAHPSVPFSFYQIPSLGRSFQMNFGFRQSRGQYILFLHADTHLPPGFVPLIKEALKREKGYDFCFFNISFREKTWALNLVSWLANHVRKIPYGDQAFCFRREFFERAGGFDYQVFLEDLDFIRKSGKAGRGYRIAVPVSTSARRYRNAKGALTPFSVFRQSLKNGWIVILSRVFGKRPCDLRGFYEGPAKRTASPSLVEVEMEGKIFTFLEAGAGLAALLMAMKLRKSGKKTFVLTVEENPLHFQAMEKNLALYRHEVGEEGFILKPTLEDLPEKWKEVIPRDHPLL